MRRFYLIISLCLSVFISNAQLIGPANGGNFDLGATLALNNWNTAVNQVGIGSTDNWAVGANCAPFSAPWCSYISPNGGTTWSYTASKADTCILYRSTTVSFPANSSCITLSFRWGCLAENIASAVEEDHFKVYLIPSTVTVNTNALNAAYQIGQIWYNNSNTWQLETFNLNPQLAGNGINYVLAFAFVADGDAAIGPAAAIDDVLLTAVTPPSAPTSCPTLVSPANGSSGLSPCSVTLSWNAVIGCTGATSYDVYFGTPAPVFIGNTTNTFSVRTALAANTTYQWYIIPRNSVGPNATCNATTYSFTTGTNPVVTGAPPFSDDFEGCNNWTLVNAGQTNVWFMGTAANNGGAQAMYITNNGGLNNQYTVTATSISHFYRDFDLTAVPAGSCVTLTFDWRARGESGFDDLRVSSSNTATVPVAGVLPGAGFTLLGGPFNLNNVFTTQSISLSPYIGTNVRITFTWRNDGSIGTQPPACVDNVAVTSTSGPANDAPCNSTFLPLGLYLTGNNTCATNADEPAYGGAQWPSCWVNGSAAQANTVWFRFICPPTGCVKIRTQRGSLYDTQIAVYRNNPLVPGTVACGSGNTLVLVGGTNCNDNAPSCNSSTYLNSEMAVTGLSPGFTYYIAVDGKNNQVGTFSVFVMDAGAACNTPFSPIPGQDCSLPNIVCQPSFNIPNPGYQAYGSICDFTTGYCLLSGERGSGWYTINISSNGQLMFDIVPNDYPGSPTDYDYAIWKLQTGNTCDGSAANGYCCTEIATGTATPASCNYSAQQVTGCYIGGNSPPAYPGFNGAYDPPINALAGETYILVVSNFANSTAGFTLNLANSTCGINYAVPPGGTIQWTGAVDGNWFNPTNWGGCNVPDCNTSAAIQNISANMPNLNAAATINNITIFPGANITLGAAAVLNVCGNYTNNGTLNANTASTVKFNGPLDANHPTGAQSLNGSMTGGNAFGNIIIDKAMGTSTVTTNQDLDDKGSFTLAATNSQQFNAAGMYHKVGGDFQINTGSYNTGLTLEMNGTVGQQYKNGGIINNFTINNSLGNTGGVTLNTVVTMGAGGVLTMTLGKIITGVNRVDVQNTSNTAVTAGNTNSFIEGTLRKYLLAGAGINGLQYEFPLGLGTNYNRASMIFRSANPIGGTSIQYLTATYAGFVPAPYPIPLVDCGVTFSQNRLNNGYWSFVQFAPSAAAGGINFDLYVYPGGYSNLAGPGWTVARNTNGTGGWDAVGNWAIQAGTFCNASAIPGSVSRRMFNGFNGGLANRYAVIQGPQPLPVELVSLEAVPQQKNIQIKWTTASETNNKGFELERSTNTDDFNFIAWKAGFGTSSIMHTYDYNDVNVSKDITYYYRLKQIDHDGRYEYSKVVAAKIKSNDFFINVQPNPYSSQTNITYIIDNDSKVKVEVLNVMGQIVKVLADEIQKQGFYQFKFSAKENGFSTGIYNIRITVDDKIYTRRIFETD